MSGACLASPSPCCLAMKLWGVEPTDVLQETEAQKEAPQEEVQEAAGVTSAPLPLYPQMEQDIPVLPLTCVWGAPSARATWAHAGLPKGHAKCSLDCPSGWWRKGAQGPCLDSPATRWLRPAW